MFIYLQTTVFKPFFVSLNLPYSVIRGEEFALQVNVFNYLKEDVNVSTQIKFVCVSVNAIVYNFVSQNTSFLSLPNLAPKEACTLHQ